MAKQTASEHTPEKHGEPWKLGLDGDVYRLDGHPACLYSDIVKPRIVVCVNACAGIETETLEEGPLIELQERAGMAEMRLHQIAAIVEQADGRPLTMEELSEIYTLASLDRPVVDPTWQPIETVPPAWKEQPINQRILVYAPPYGPGSANWDRSRGRWNCHFCLNDEAEPTHWMPLSRPPVTP